MAMMAIDRLNRLRAHYGLSPLSPRHVTRAEPGSSFYGFHPFLTDLERRALPSGFSPQQGLVGVRLAFLEKTINGHLAPEAPPIKPPKWVPAPEYFFWLGAEAGVV